jgi:hypothetical protein
MDGVLKREKGVRDTLTELFLIKNKNSKEPQQTMKFMNIFEDFIIWKGIILG